MEVVKKELNRGDITFWFSREAIDAWTPPKNGKRGGQPNPDHTTVSRRNQTVNACRDRGQYGFEDLRSGRTALQEAWKEAAQTLEETTHWRG